MVKDPSIPRLLALAFFVYASIVPCKSEPLTLTNQQNQSLTAELLAVEGGQARVRRASDGKEFSIQISTLNVESQQAILSWQSKKVTNAGSLGSWRRLTIETTHPADEIEIVGVRPLRLTDGLATRYGATREVLLPPGAWLLVRPVQYGQFGNAVGRGGLLPYYGESNWKLSLSPFGILVQRDNGEPRLEALISLTDSETFLDDFKRPRLNHGVSVSGKLVAEIDEFRRRGLTVHAIQSDSLGHIEDSVIRDLQKIPLKCISAGIYVEDLKDLNGLNDIEALRLEIKLRKADDVADFDPSQWAGFGSFPALRHLEVGGSFFRAVVEVDKSLPNLISLVLNGGLSDRTTPHPWCNAAVIPNLEAFSGNWINLAELGKLQNLKHLGIAVEPRDGQLDSLFNLSGLIQLELYGKETAEDAAGIDEWVASGNLANVINLYTNYLSSLGGMRAIESLNGVIPGDGNLGGLRSFALKSNRPQEGAPETLGSVTGGEQLESLSIEGGVFTKPEQIRRFRNLHHLRLSNSDTIPLLNLSDFSNLESVEVLDCDLETMSIVPSDSKLRRIFVKGCDDLSSIDGTGPNATIEILDIAGCKNLAALDGLRQTSGLRVLSICVCEKIPAPLGLDQTNPNLEIIHIARCGNVKNSRIIKYARTGLP